MDRLRGPAYRIETTRTTLRCLEPEHFDPMTRVIAESVEHLRPWMAWAAHEPLSDEARLERLRTNRGHFDLGSDLTYGIFDKPQRMIMGVAALKLSTVVDERELGYWLHPGFVGKGLMHEVCLALVRVGFALEPLDAIELRCAPDNVRSMRVAERLGFAGPTLDPLSGLGVDGEKRDTLVYTMARVQYASSPAHQAAIEAYDVLDRRIF